MRRAYSTACSHDAIDVPEHEIGFVPTSRSTSSPKQSATHPRFHVHDAMRFGPASTNA
jgi:hypothetical protein